MKKISESIWSDLQDRSSGEVIRKEDDVNLLDLNEFYKYIKEQYRTKVEYIELDSMGGGNGVVLGVDITEDIILFYKPERGHILLSWSKVKIPMPFFDELTDRFKVENPNAMRRIITEKDGSCTNKTFIDAIEFFLGHKESMMNESIWSDLQDRSSGEVVRKEDERYKILERLLATYIKLFAESCYYHDEYTSGSYPDFRAYIKDFRNNPRIEEVCPDDSYFDDLLNYVNRDTWNDQIDDTIMEMTDRLNKGEHLIVDDVIEELRKHSVNESIWSDLQDRSSGETVRKEDAYDIDENELEKGIDVCIRRFVIQSVYYDRYDKSPDTFYDCMKNWDENIVTRAQLYDRRHKTYINPKDVIPSFIRNNWKTGENYKVKVEETISDLEEEIRKTGFTKKPGESINDTLSKWFDDHQDEIADEYSSDIEEYAEEYYREGGSHNVDIGVEDWWDHIEFITQINIYQEHKNDMNESIWSDLQDRSSGEIVRKEDEFTEKDRKDLDTLIVSYANEVVYGRGMNTDACNLDDFCDYIETDNEIKDLNKDKVLQYVEDYWADEVCDSVDGAIEQAQSEYHQDMYESVWSDLQDRSSGEVVRKEDEMTSDDYRNLKVVLKMFGREVRFFGDNKNKKFFPVKAKKYEITLEDCLYFIDVLVDGKFTGTDFSKLKRYIEVNWERDPMIKNIIQWTVDGKNSKEIDQEIRNASKSDEFWDLNECDGVPGGITPADVGGMGAAYFPGPNGEPGSGDLPSPTGVVYHQVAPYTMFLKGQKKKKKKKKFRIEDEPCAHSKNSKTYDYVDDFREYVDRTYNNIDRRK